MKPFGAAVRFRRGALADHRPCMASAALPFSFPQSGCAIIGMAMAVCDSLRRCHPHCVGSKRILAVSPRVKPKSRRGLAASYPSPGQVAGVMLNAVFLDLLILMRCRCSGLTTSCGGFATKLGPSASG